MIFKVYVSKDTKPKEIMSKLIESIIHHVPYSSEDTLREYMKWCYETVYLKNNKMHKSREKELNYVLKQTGIKLRECFYERYQRGFESATVVGGKRLREVDISMMKTTGRPKKKGRK